MEEREFSRQILGLAVPMTIEMFMQSLVLLVDIFFVARLGGEAVAAVGMVGVLAALFLTVAWGLGEGATAMVARRIGENDTGAAGCVATNALLLSGALGTVIGLGVALRSVDLLTWMGASADLATDGRSYASLILGGSGVLWFIVVGNSLLRAAGDAGLALRVFLLTNALNLGLDPFLIFGWGPFPELGLAGAAVATLVGWMGGGLYIAIILMRGRGRIRCRRSWPDFGIIKRLTKLAAPAVASYLAAELGLVMLFRLLASFGPTALAAFTLCTRFQLADGLSSGLSHAAKTLTGQNLGAGRPDAAESVAWRVGFYNLAALLGVAAIYVFQGKMLLGLFSDDPQVIALAWQCQLWVCGSFAFQAFGGVLEQSLIGAGDTSTPALVNTGGLWLCQLPLAYLLGVVLGFGATGVFAALGIYQALLNITLIILFQRGAWKHICV